MTDVVCPVILTRGKNAGKICGKKNCYHRRKTKEETEKNKLKEAMEGFLPSQKTGFRAGEILNRISEETEKSKLKEIIVSRFLLQHPEIHVNDIIAYYLKEGGTLVDGPIIRPLVPKDVSIEFLHSVVDGKIPFNILM